MHSEILNAQDDFQSIMKDVGYEKLKIKDEEGNVVTGLNVLAMALPDMWLARLMIRADDVARAITEERVFDVGYKYDNKTLTGIVPAELSDEEATEYGYDSKVIKDDELRKIIMKHAVMTSIEVVDGFAFLKEFESYYLKSENDKFVRPMTNDFLVASLLRDFTSRAAPMIEIALEQSKGMEMTI
jgi:hypothetical protein